jgi:hypothetical protein
MLDSILIGSHYNSRFLLVAVSGSTIDLGNVGQIVDPSEGDVRYRSVHITSNGSDSIIDLHSLELFVDTYAGSSTNENLSSTIRTIYWRFPSTPGG